MKKSIFFIVILALLSMTTTALAVPPESKNFVAVLSGADEVPARDTNARGAAVFNLAEDGAVLHYRLIAANIDNVVAAHIHCGLPGFNGPVGVNLFVGGAPGSGRFSGVLASGSITAPNAVNGCGWTDLDDVLTALRSGGAYVNVHTNDGLPGTNTGPGDFAAGEIRGQVVEAGATP